MNSNPVVNLQKQLYLFFIEWISFSPSLWSMKFTTKKSTIVLTGWTILNIASHNKLWNAKGAYYVIFHLINHTSFAPRSLIYGLMTSFKRICYVNVRRFCGSAFRLLYASVFYIYKYLRTTSGSKCQMKRFCITCERKAEIKHFSSQNTFKEMFNEMQDCSQCNCVFYFL